MKPKKLFALPLLVLTVVAVFAAAYAEDSDKLGPYKLLTTIDIPGGLTGFDISWVDSEAGRYYLADRGNATATPPVLPRIDVIDTKHNKFLFSIPGFAGGNGIVAIHGAGDDDEFDQPSSGELWVGDANSTAKIVDVANPKGEVDEINPTTMKITRIFPTTCGPAGLALIPGQRLMTSCGDVLDIATGAVLHTVTPTVGGDEIWFNSGDERVYFGGGTNRISVDVV